MLQVVPEAVPAPPPVAGPLFRRTRYVRRPRLVDILLKRGLIQPRVLTRALMLQGQIGCRLQDVLLAEGMVEPADLAEVLGQQYGMGSAGPAPTDCPAADALARQLPAHLCLRHSAIPWRKVGDTVLIATSDPSRIDALKADLPHSLQRCRFAIVPESVLTDRIGAVHGDLMARAAECRVPEAMSCRGLRDRSGASLMALGPLLLVAGIGFAPMSAIGILSLIGLAVVAMNVSLRLAAYLGERRASAPIFASARGALRADRALPRISILVPLHNEPSIAAPLTRRLSRLDYPRALLEVALVVEAGDHATREALAQANLPPWMRVIAVPDGHPRTKPRAMNYALPLTTGDIVGIYDAEDAPAPDQLRRIADRFAVAPSRVACLQGCLDYYNSTRNWMARCFTIEYAGWFRQMLPGIAQIGLVVPLGGTTLFFRRTALERVGAWDAHNVTEDADLGLRLARYGYRTEIVPTTTLEEANAAPLPWIRQRSRWMKGYLLTWSVHCRNPARLWRDLGPRKFFGVHFLFLGAILNATLMPFLWSLAIIPFGFGHPIDDFLPETGRGLVAGLLTILTVTHLALTYASCRAPHHTALRPWIPTMIAYAPLSILAVGKALLEIGLKPFHWDKTTHGQHGGVHAKSEINQLQEALIDGADRPMVATRDRRLRAESYSSVVARSGSRPDRVVIDPASAR